MSNKVSNNSTSIATILGVVFVVLKLTNYIDWSWWYVTLPFWIGFVVAFVIGVIYIIYTHFKS